MNVTLCINWPMCTAKRCAAKVFIFSATEQGIAMLSVKTLCLICTSFTDDLPELQEVQDDQSSPAVFQVAPGVSHEERPEQVWSLQSESCSISHTNWLTELANIATSPQSPLLQNAPYPR